MSNKSQRDGDNEPSMEEILASIRKIISEDSEANQSRSAQHTEKQEHTDRAESTGSETSDPAESPRPTESMDPAESSEPRDEGVLELTEEVPSDTAEEETDKESALGPGPVFDARNLGLEDDGEDDRAEVASEGDGVLDLEEDAEDVDDPAAARATAREPARPGEAESERDAMVHSGGAGGDEPGHDDSLSDEDLEAPSASGDFANDAVGVNDPREDDDMTANTGGAAEPRRESFLSDEASGSATAALSELARAANARDFGEGAPKSDADRILEGLVREALRPQLKAWLDENLPGLVERIVREEVRRMSRRAESVADDERQE